MAAVRMALLLANSFSAFVRLVMSATTVTRPVTSPASFRR